MSAHTPGPWTVEESMINDLAPFDANGRHLLHPGSEIGTKERQANARLIAAAPELLAACEVLAAAYEAGAENGGSMEWSDVDDAWVLAREAIAKAKGGES